VVVQRCSGAVVLSCSRGAAEVQRWRGTEVQRYSDAVVQWCSGAEVQQRFSRGAVVQRCRGAEVGTEVQ